MKRALSIRCDKKNYSVNSYVERIRFSNIGAIFITVAVANCTTVARIVVVNLSLPPLCKP